MDKQTYKLIEDYMISCMEDSAHDKEHVYRVLYNALAIAQGVAGSPNEMDAQGEANSQDEPSEQVDYDVLICACLLHDIGRKEQFEDPSLCHAMVGGEKAYRFLTEHGFSTEFAETIRACIQTHRFRKSNPPATLEAKILFDADKLDVVGAIGIARTLVYKGEVVEPLYTLLPDGSVSDGTNEEPASFFKEYRYKLEGLYDKFYTAKGAALAKARQPAAVAFYESMLHEVKDSYQDGMERLNELLK